MYLFDISKQYTELEAFFLNKNIQVFLNMRSNNNTNYKTHGLLSFEPVCFMDFRHFHAS